MDNQDKMHISANIRVRASEQGRLWYIPSSNYSLKHFIRNLWSMLYPAGIAKVTMCLRIDIMMNLCNKLFSNLYFIFWGRGRFGLRQTKCLPVL